MDSMRWSISVATVFLVASRERLVTGQGQYKADKISHTVECIITNAAKWNQVVSLNGRDQGKTWLP